jgi:hypothetical protein
MSLYSWFPSQHVFVTNTKKKICEQYKIKAATKRFAVLVISWPHLRLRFPPSCETCPFSAARRRWHNAQCDTQHHTYRPSVLLATVNSIPRKETSLVFWHSTRGGRSCPCAHHKDNRGTGGYICSHRTSELQVSGQLHAPTALPDRKKPPIRIQAPFTPQSVWTFQRDTSLPLKEIEPRSAIVHPVA